MGRSERHATDRKPTVLQAEALAESLFVHTVRIMSNPKYFNPSEDFNNMTLIHLYETALEVWMRVHEANAVDVRSEPHTASERLQLQSFALVAMERLLLLQKAAKRIFKRLGKTTKKFWYWADMSVKAKDAIKAWHKSDRERFAPLLAAREDFRKPEGDAGNGSRLNSALGGLCASALGQP